MPIEADILRRLLFWERERLRQLREQLENDPDKATERLVTWSERRVRALEQQIEDASADHDRPGYDRGA